MNEDHINYLTAKYAAALQNKVAGMIQSPSPAVSAAINRLENTPVGELSAAKQQEMRQYATQEGLAGAGRYLTDRDVDMSGTRLMSLNPLTAIGDAITDSNRLGGFRSSESEQNTFGQGLQNLSIPAALAGGIGAAGTRIGSPLLNAAGLGYNPFTPLALQSVAQQEAYIRANFGYGEGKGLGKGLENVKAVPIAPRSVLGALFGTTPNTTGAGGDLKITQRSAIDPANTHPIRLVDKVTNLEIGTLDSGKRPFFDPNFGKAAPPHPTNNTELAKALANKTTGGRAGKAGLLMGLLQLLYGGTRNYSGSENPNAPFMDKILGQHEVDISAENEDAFKGMNAVGK